MPRILHFADAHIDIANYGKRDPASSLPLRVIDFLNSLDEIVDTAITEKVDCVLFAGDAYKDQSPSPTYQREWGRRIMRLSEAKIPTVILVGNHDISPAAGRAHALDEFNTLQVPHVLIIDQPGFYSREDLNELTPEGKSLEMQLIALPWISRAAMAADLEMPNRDMDALYKALENKLTEDIEGWLEKSDPGLPTLLAAHATVEGATEGGERAVSLGADFVLPKRIAADPRLDYTALGHIHKTQDLNPDKHPPVIYPGSIERVNFGEAADDKFFLIAEVEKGKTKLDWRQLEGIRPFVDLRLKLESNEDITQQVNAILPGKDKLGGAMARLALEYPRSWEPLIDEAAIRDLFEACFEFHFLKQPIYEPRIRLPEDKAVGSLTAAELLDEYWKVSGTPEDEIEYLNRLAGEVLESDEK
jgi:exonuclease SbcD